MAVFTTARSTATSGLNQGVRSRRRPPVDDHSWQPVPGSDSGDTGRLRRPAPTRRPGDLRARMLDLQRTVGNQAVLRLIETADAPRGVIQRHSAYEHYLLGQVAPDDLANLPFIREAVAAQKRAKEEQKRQQQWIERASVLLFGVGGLVVGGAASRLLESVAPPRPVPPVDTQKLEQAKHTLEQEMDRLEAFIKDPEAIPARGDQAIGEVKKVDGKWQIPYVEIPVRDGEKVVVAYSEINTMPDLFGNPEAIAQTPKSQVLALLQGIRQQTYIKLDQLYTEIFGTSRYKLGRTYAFGTDFQGATGPRGQAINPWIYEKRTESQVNAATLRKGEESEQYFAALERNACHFAPASWKAWEDYHNKALDEARKAADLRKQARDQQRPSDREKQEEEARAHSNQAFLLNAFGEHYLQDSFAAGHLIDKTRIMQWFVQYLDRTGVELGSTSAAQAEWSMVKMVANQENLTSNPQALHDKIVRGEIRSFEAASAEIGMAVQPEILLMMKWRELAAKSSDRKKLTLADATRLWPESNMAQLKNQLERLVELGFASRQARKLSGRLQPTIVYSLDQGQIDVVKGKGPYEARTQGQGAQTQAAEFNVAAYNAFLSNAYVQAATKFFHDKYCKEGLVVKAGNGEDLGRIYGDENMLKAGGQKGVQYSAETSRWSREAIFNAIYGEPEGHTTEEIANRFPKTVIDDGRELPIADWWNALKKSGDEGSFKEAKSLAARLGYKFMKGGGISGGHAIAIEKIPHEPF